VAFPLGHYDEISVAVKHWKFLKYNNNNNNNNNKLKTGCRPVSVVIIHVHRCKIRI